MKEIVKKIFNSLPINDNNKDRIKYFYKTRISKEIEEIEKIDIYKEKTNLKKEKIKDIKKVSVVVPNYNYANYIIERIDSILNQSYPIHELIILDDNSKDDSCKVIENKIKTIKKLEVKFIKNEKNSGNVFAQWKKGFELATGDYIWIAEADDSSNCDFLKVVMKGFEDKNVVMSYCESLTMDTNNNILMKDLREWIDIFNCGKWENNYIIDGIEEITSTLCINNTVANVSSVVFKNGEYLDIIEKAKNFRLAGDWYVYMKIMEQGKVAYFKDSLNYHRMHQKGVTLTMDKNREFDEIVKVQEEALNNYEISIDIKNKVLERRERVRQSFGL